MSIGGCAVGVGEDLRSETRGASGTSRGRLSSTEEARQREAALIDEFTGLVYHIVRRALDRSQDDDLQEALIDALKAIRSYDPLQGSLMQWIALLVKQGIRHRMMAARTKKRWHVRAELDFEPTDHRPMLDRMEISQLAERAMQSLTPLQKRYVQNYFWGGQTVEEVAVEAGVTKQSVSQGIRLGLRRARKELGVTATNADVE